MLEVETDISKLTYLISLLQINKTLVLVMYVAVCIAIDSKTPRLIGVNGLAIQNYTFRHGPPKNAKIKKGASLDQFYI